MKKIIIIAGAIILLFIAADIAARIWFPTSSPDSTLGKSFSLNSLGLRDKDYTIPKPPVKYRIMTLGDGLVWGIGLEENLTFPRQLEKSLGSQYSGVEVINAGCPGFNAIKQRIVMQNLVDNYTPDMLLLFYNLNDVMDSKKVKGSVKSSTETNNIYEDDASEFMAMQKSGAKKIPFFTRNFRIVNLADQWFVKTFHTLGLNKNPRYEWIYNIDKAYSEENPGWTAAKNALAEMRDICAQRGIVFKVFIYPVMTDFNKYPAKKSHNAVMEACSQMRIDCVDLLTSFEGKNGYDLWVSPFNRLPSTEAHKIAVDAISPDLKNILEQARIPHNANAR